MYLFVTNMRRVWIEVFVYNKLGCDMNLLVANMRRVWIEVADKYHFNVIRILQHNPLRNSDTALVA